MFVKTIEENLLWTDINVFLFTVLWDTVSGSLPTSSLLPKVLDVKLLSTGDNAKW